MFHVLLSLNNVPTIKSNALLIITANFEEIAGFSAHLLNYLCTYMYLCISLPSLHIHHTLDQIQKNTDLKVSFGTSLYTVLAWYQWFVCIQAI